MSIMKSVCGGRPVRHSTWTTTSSVVVASSSMVLSSAGMNYPLITLFLVAFRQEINKNRYYLLEKFACCLKMGKIAIKQRRFRNNIKIYNYTLRVVVVYVVVMSIIDRPRHDGVVVDAASSF